MPRKSLSEEIDQRRQVEYFLNEGVLSVYAIARKVGVSETTVRKYRDLLTKALPPLAPPSASAPVPSPLSSDPDPLWTEEAPTFTVRVVPLTHLYQRDEIVLYKGIRRTVTYVHPDGLLDLRQAVGQLWSAKRVDPADVTPL